MLKIHAQQPQFEQVFTVLQTHAFTNNARGTVQTIQTVLDINEH